MKKDFFCLVYFIIAVLSGYSYSKSPEISIITSLYKGDEFIVGFLNDITHQTIFNNCELIIINAASPGNEESIIKKYVKKHDNIIYKKLDYDPGIYAVWNMAIKMAQGEFITNANVDDRLAYNCYAIHLDQLKKAPTVDLVYSDCYMTKVPNETFEKNNAYKIINRPEFSKKELKKNCLPNNHPMWRKSMHLKYGYFDETYKIAGDWEMWLRAVKNGSQFVKVPLILSLYYENPEGLSTDQNGNWKKEFLRVYHAYKNI